MQILAVRHIQYAVDVNGWHLFSRRYNASMSDCHHVRIFTCGNFSDTLCLKPEGKVLITELAALIAAAFTELCCRN